jgi:hypothetical protein
VSVDTHERSTSRTATAARDAPLGTSTAFDDRDEGADELVTATIAAAAGTGAAQ